MKKQVVTWSLIITLVITLAACGSSNNANTGSTDNAGESNAASAESDTAAQNNTDDSSVGDTALGKTYSVLVQPTGKIVDITTNDFTLWLEEETGVHLDFTVLSSDAQETVSMMLNSGENLPDILMVPLSYVQQYLYGQQGVLLNLSPLIEQNAPRIAQAHRDYPLYTATSTRPDGNIYYISAYEECYHCTGSQKMWINQRWLDNLGLNMPSTTDEFKQTLIAFRDQDANGNGDPNDEVPMSGMATGWHPTMYSYLMNAFIYYAGNQNPMYVQNGTVAASFSTPEWREGMAYINDLFREGLIDENAFVQDQAALQALTTGEHVLTGAIPEGHTAMFVTIDSPNIFDFAAVPPLKGPNGVQYSAYFPNVAKSGDGIAISSSCSDPEGALAWVDFLFGEEATIRSQYGVMGRDWEYNDDPTILGLHDGQALFHTFGNAPVYASTQLTAAWEHTGPFLWVSYIFAGQAVLGGEGYDLEKVLYDATKNYEPYFPDEFAMNLSFDGDDAEFMAMNRQLMADFISQSSAEFIIGTRDITNDNDWDAYLTELEGYGLSQYVEVMQRGYDAQQAIIASLR